MFKRKMKVTLNYEERRLLVESLIDLKNDLIRQGRYTDALDEILIKIVNAT